MNVISEHVKQERASHRDLFERAGIDADEIIAISSVLQRIANVDLEDLLRPPAVNLSPFDGEVTSVNGDTPEYQHYARMSDLRNRVAHVNEDLQDYWWHSLRGGQ